MQYFERCRLSGLQGLYPSTSTGYPRKINEYQDTQIVWKNVMDNGSYAVSFWQDWVSSLRKIALRERGQAVSWFWSKNGFGPSSKNGRPIGWFLIRRDTTLTNDGAHESNQTKRNSLTHRAKWAPKPMGGPFGHVDKMGHSLEHWNLNVGSDIP